MRAVGVTGYVVNGGEARGLDVLEVNGARTEWTVALPNGGPARTFASDDPAVAAFLRDVFGFRALPSSDPAQPTSEAGPGAFPPGPG